MLEDQTTIAKAIAQINDLVGKKDGQSVNQLARWSTKEDHTKQNPEDHCRIFPNPENKIIISQIFRPVER